MRRALARSADANGRTSYGATCGRSGRSRRRTAAPPLVRGSVALRHGPVRTPCPPDRISRDEAHTAHFALGIPAAGGKDPSRRQAPATPAGRSGRTPSPAAVRTPGRHQWIGRSGGPEQYGTTDRAPRGRQSLGVKPRQRPGIFVLSEPDRQSFTGGLTKGTAVPTQNQVPSPLTSDSPAAPPPTGGPRSAPAATTPPATPPPPPGSPGSCPRSPSPPWAGRC